MLEWVIKAAQKSATYLNRGPKNLEVDVALLIPEGDKLGEIYRHRRDLYIVTGDEHNVLSRYSELADHDYVVRITSDCPLIPPEIISHHITKAVQYDLDYVSNVDPDHRMHPDGWDCEVMSSKMLSWVCENAEDDFDLEHVTTLIRKQKPQGYLMANVIGRLDISHLKLSVDTEEDLDFVRTYQKICSDKTKKAKSKSSADRFYII